MPQHADLVRRLPSWICTTALATFAVAVCFESVAHGQSAADGKAENPPPVVDNGLPPGFVPPPKPTAAMLTNKEWRFSPFGGDAKVEKQQKDKYSQLRVRGTVTSPEEKKLIRDIIGDRLSKMSLKANRDKVVEIRNEIVKDLSGKTSDFRNEVIDAILELAPNLFDCHLTPRLQVVYLLNDLTEPEQDGATAPPQPLLKSTNLLLQLLTDKEQPQPIHLVALNGLVRIMSHEGFKGDYRYNVTNAVVDGLRNSKSQHFWLQLKYAIAVGETGSVRDRVGKRDTEIVLLETAVDSQRPFVVRAEALQALGKLPLDGESPADKIAAAAVGLTIEFATEFAKPGTEASKSQTYRYAHFIAIPILTTFKFDPALGKGKSFGLMHPQKNIGSANKRYVQDAYSQIEPVLAQLLKVSEAPEKRAEVVRQLLPDLKKWFAANGR